jgi:hypothetical protein
VIATRYLIAIRKAGSHLSFWLCQTPTKSDRAQPTVAATTASSVERMDFDPPTQRSIVRSVNSGDSVTSRHDDPNRSRITNRVRFIFASALIFVENGCFYVLFSFLQWPERPVVFFLFLALLLEKEAGKKTREKNLLLRSIQQ